MRSLCGQNGWKLREYGVNNTFIHCFMDSSDIGPKSGKGFIAASAHMRLSAARKLKWQMKKCSPAELHFFRDIIELLFCFGSIGRIFGCGIGF